MLAEWQGLGALKAGAAGSRAMKEQRVQHHSGHGELVLGKIYCCNYQRKHPTIRKDRVYECGCCCVLFDVVWF